MSQWISHIKNMASQLREVGEDVSTERVSNRILNGLGKEYQGLRYGLKAGAGPLKVEVVTQMLLAAEMELREEKENAVNVSSNTKKHIKGQIQLSIMQLKRKPILLVCQLTRRRSIH